jgi:CRISPR-associated endonuclease/helicase Cas3
MEHIAHKTEDGREQSILDHLTGTAELARQNAVPLMQELAYAAGLAHDIGKYAQAFQDRIQHGSKQKYEHALGGALEYWKLHGKPMHPFLTVLLAYCIAGHHTGLPDGGQKSDSAEESTLRGRLQREPDYKAEKDYQAFCTEVTLPQPECSSRKNTARKVPCLPTPARNFPFRRTFTSSA